MTAIDWERPDSWRAMREGWDIFWTNSADHAPFELQRMDDPMAVPELGYDEPKFEDDPGAWRFVFAGAEAGNEHHMKAVLFLREKSPAELDHIKTWLAEHD